MTRYRIDYDRNTCIGAAICATLDAENFVMVEDGKADLLRAREDPERKGWFTLEVDDSLIDFEKLKQAAEGCPVNAIHITNLETGEKLL